MPFFDQIISPLVKTQELFVGTKIVIDNKRNVLCDNLTTTKKIFTSFISEASVGGGVTIDGITLPDIVITNKIIPTNLKIQWGPENTSAGDYGIAIGFNTIAAEGASTAIGYDAEAYYYGVGVGYDVEAGSRSVVVGRHINAFGEGVAFGEGMYAHVESVGIGNEGGCLWNSQCIGSSSFAGWRSIAIGFDCWAAEGSIALGNDARTGWNHGIAIGSDSEANGSRSIAIGEEAYAEGSSSVAIGRDSTSYGSSSIAIGRNCDTDGSRGIAIGRGADADNYQSVAIGCYAYTNADYHIQLGSQYNYYSYGSGQLKFKTQQVCTEEWITSPNSLAFIDANGNMQKTTPTSFDTFANQGDAFNAGKLSGDTYFVTDGSGNFFPSVLQYD